MKKYNVFNQLTGKTEEASTYEESLILQEKIIDYLNDPSKYSTLRKLKQAISNKNNINRSNW
jgi:hypothetical protein